MLPLLAEWLVFGSLFFWIFVLLEFFVLMTCAAFEKGIFATASLVVFAVVLQSSGSINILNQIATHPIEIACGALIYGIIGILWAYYKTRRTIQLLVDEYDDEKAKFLRDNNATVDQFNVDAKLRTKWKDIVEDRYNPKPCFKVQNTNIMDYKARFLRWSALWIPSFIWFLINDFVVGLFTAAFRKLSSRLQRMADGLVKGIKSDLNLPTEPTE